MAKDLEEAKGLLVETLEKVYQGYACLVKWENIKDKPPPQLKKLLCLAILHNSKKLHDP